jgi:hypothetical protein
VAAFLAAIELSNQPTMPAAVSAMFVFVFDAVVLFGLARLTDLITAVHAARDELAEAAVTEERVRAADSLRAAVGGRLADRAGRPRGDAVRSCGPVPALRRGGHPRRAGPDLMAITGSAGHYRHTGTGAPGKLGDVRPRRIGHQDRAARANRTDWPGTAQPSRWLG